MSTDNFDIQHAYASLMDQLLDICMAHIPHSAPIQIYFRLLKKRLKHPMSAAEIDALRLFISTVSNKDIEDFTLEKESIITALAPFITNINKTVTDDKKQATITATSPTTAPSSKSRDTSQIKAFSSQQTPTQDIELALKQINNILIINNDFRTQLTFERDEMANHTTQSTLHQQAYQGMTKEIDRLLKRDHQIINSLNRINTILQTLTQHRLDAP